MDSLLKFERLDDADLIDWQVNRLAPELNKGFSAKDWLGNPAHIALTNGRDIGLFERERAAWNAHWLLQSRGREALLVGKAMLKWLFANSDASVIKGLTPLQQRAARWFNRQLGGKSFGIIETAFGPVELFILERQQ